MTTEAADAIGYGQDLRKMVQRSLIERGHSACPGNENARYSFPDQRIFCGCGKSYEMVGAQPVQAEPGVALEQRAPRDPVQAHLSTIDPTLAYTPVDLEMRILDVLARLEQGALFERSAIDEAARAQLAWKKAFWIAKQASEASAADKREAEAYVATMELYERHLETEWVRKAVQATMHNLRSILSGYQSVAKSVTADMGAGGSVR